MIKKILFIFCSLIASIGISQTVTDIDGNVYKTVTIGNQEWMAENLKVSKYNDGSSIPNVTDSSQWSVLTTGAWCYYDNDSQYDNTYGKLYNWYAVNSGELCPAGWHVPTLAEWTALTDYLGANGHKGAEGRALKSTSGWIGNGNGIDIYGWNGVPGGIRTYTHNYLFNFNSLGKIGQ